MWGWNEPSPQRRIHGEQFEPLHPHYPRDPRGGRVFDVKLSALFAVHELSINEETYRDGDGLTVQLERFEHNVGNCQNKLGRI